MTSRLIDEYLGSRTYYAITVDGDIDNPDQRIQEEMSPVIDAVTRVPSNLLNALMNIGVQVAILATIAMPMLVATLLYCALNAVVTYLINKPTIKQHWTRRWAEADLRFGLLHVRDHAETDRLLPGRKGRARAPDRQARVRHCDAMGHRPLPNQNGTGDQSNQSGVDATACPVRGAALLQRQDRVRLDRRGNDGCHAYQRVDRRVHPVHPRCSRDQCLTSFAWRRSGRSSRCCRPTSMLSISDISAARSRGESIGFSNVTLMTPGGERTLLQRSQRLTLRRAAAAHRRADGDR